MSKKRYLRKVPSRCECGRPSLRAGEESLSRGCLTGSACERCARIEAETNTAADARCGSDRLSDGLRITRRAEESTFADVRNACDRYLKARGLCSDVSSHFIHIA